MKAFKLFETDYYQISMALAYILDDRANDTAGFEAFTRRIKSEINPNGDEYVFSGEKEVHDLIAEVRRELEDPELIETFLTLALKGIDEDRQPDIELAVREKWKRLRTGFDYSVYPESGSVQAYVPVFQYVGPRWVGQLLETKICNTINGRTGARTYRRYGTGTFRMKWFGQMVSGRGFDWEGEYDLQLEQRAFEFRKATPQNIVLLEAGLRRAPSQHCANLATYHARKAGWSGSSNVAATFQGVDRRTDEPIPLDFIGGTMAHSFVMSYEREIDAFKAWDRIFPNSTILIDTYGTIEAAKKLIRYGIKPADVRIDCEPLDLLARDVRNLFDENGWDDVGIFISGDLTPERITELVESGVPFDKYMAGTKYVNHGFVGKINPGFVYKLVEYEHDGEVYYPAKRSNNKMSISGLKRVEMSIDEITVDCRPGRKPGIYSEPINPVTHKTPPKVRFFNS